MEELMKRLKGKHSNRKCKRKHHDTQEIKQRRQRNEHKIVHMGDGIQKDLFTRRSNNTQKGLLTHAYSTTTLTRKSDSVLPSPYIVNTSSTENVLTQPLTTVPQNKKDIDPAQTKEASTSYSIKTITHENTPIKELSMSSV